MAYRNTPYTVAVRAPGLCFWSGESSATHTLKADKENADVTTKGLRFLGVLDGVSGVRDQGMEPIDLPLDLAVRMRDEMTGRLDRCLNSNAQIYDRDVHRVLYSSVAPSVPGEVIKRPKCIFEPWTHTFS